MRLREFSADGDGIATLVCAPLALHDATLTDFAPGHSSRCGSASSMLERGDLDQKLDRFVASGGNLPLPCFGQTAPKM